ncbi:CD1871A family CXXC motif-containing protein [Paraclostridium sordellii]|uniref:CD1871A family CXXC motif-containing protein n=1 Tax=Paraclostridium sordellii TaxID=1505 RepID=UPI002FE5F9BC
MAVSNFIIKNKIGLFLISLGIVFFLIGIHRGEYLVVAKKSKIICLECIGIG